MIARSVPANSPPGLPSTRRLAASRKPRLASNVPYLALSCGCLAVGSGPVAASPEGAALVQPVLWIVLITLAALVLSLTVGTVAGIVGAKRRGEPLIKGALKGVLKGIVAFILVSAGTLGVVTVLGMGYVAYALLTTY